MDLPILLYSYKKLEGMMVVVFTGGGGKLQQEKTLALNKRHNLCRYRCFKQGKCLFCKIIYHKNKLFHLSEGFA